MDALQNVQQVSPNYKKAPTTGQTNPTTTPPEQKKDGNKKLVGALVALGVIAAAGVAIYKGKGGKKLKDIKFNNGLATCADDSSKLFTGKIKDTLKNGDKIVLEYEDGVLKQSQRAGKANVIKRYTKAENGDKIVEIFDNPKKGELNLGRTQNITQEAAAAKAKDEAAKAAKAGEQAVQQAQEQAAKA